MSCNLGKTGTRFTGKTGTRFTGKTGTMFTVNSQAFVILFWFLVRHSQVLGKNKRCAGHAGCVSRRCLSVYCTLYVVKFFIGLIPCYWADFCRSFGTRLSVYALITQLLKN